MNKLKKHSGFIVGCFFLLGQCSMAQNDISLNGYLTASTALFQTYTEKMAGDTSPDYIHPQFENFKNNTNIPNWKVTVKALGNFVNQSNPSATVPVQYASLQFNDVNKNLMAPVNQSPIPLGTSETDLITGAPALTAASTGYYLVYDYDLIIQGGNHLLAPNGFYKVSLEFSLYDGNNIFIDSWLATNVQFEIRGSGSGGGSSLVLQNSSDNIQFQFANPNDYSTGLSISKLLGLKVVSYQDYQVIVKTNASVLSSSTTSHTIPVSAVTLEVDQTQENLPNLIMNTLNLSASDQVYIDNPSTNYLYHEVQYDLRYFIPPSNTDDVLGPAATYTTTVYFILVPK
jgi:hypothetical protein